jgi:hypothetical protein
VNTRRGTRKTERGSIGTARSPVVRGGLDARFTVLAIEKALEELGIHGTFSDIVCETQSSERDPIASCRKTEQMC